MATQSVAVDVIRDLVAQGRAACPELAGRLERAAFIAAFRAVTLVDAEQHVYQVESDAKPGSFYTVNGQCECPDWPRAPRGYCKHRLAVGLVERAAKLTPAPEPEPPTVKISQTYSYARHGRRNWAVLDEDGELVAITLYKRGAESVIDRLTLKDVAA